MNVCLISPLSVSDFIDPDLTLGTYHRKMGPQLGILCLAAALIEKGISVEIVNLDQCFFDFVEGQQQKYAAQNDESEKCETTCVNKPSILTLIENTSPAAFFEHLLNHFETLAFDVYGFGSICSSYPLTLRLAGEVKRLHPNGTIIVGGPQASVVDRQTIKTFPAVDYVVRGEADITLPRLISSLDGANHAAEIENMPGITFRLGDDVVRNPNTPIIENLDDLPLPAFHLDPHIHARSGVHLEIGRGCPFTCTFCSTNDFFRRNFRLKSPAKMVEQMRQIKETYGIRNFSLVHDMYTVNRKEVVAFCEALLASKEDFIWSCSARTDCIDDDLIALMAESGCRGIFFGIETGSARLQKVINKKLDLSEATERIRAADKHGISTAVALITAFPDETREDLRDTVHYFVNSLRLDHAEPQLSLLAPLAETPIMTQYRQVLVFDHIFSDMSHQGWRQDPRDVDLIKSCPEVFPNFYAVPTVHLSREYFREVHDFLTAVTAWFRWLPVALIQDSGDFLKVFDEWKAWRAVFSTEEEAEKGNTPYHNRVQFAREFSDFIDARYLGDMATASAVISAINKIERSPRKSEEPEIDLPEEAAKITGRLFPYKAPGIRQVDLDVDYKQVIKCLRDCLDFGRVRAKKVSVAFFELQPKVIEVRQLGDLASALLRLCDGKRTVDDLIEEVSQMEIGVDGIPISKMCFFGLSWLHQQQLIRFAVTPREMLPPPQLSAPAGGHQPETL